MICDFHLHSNVSDGTLAPAEVVEAAAREGVGVLSLTDHDDVSGVPEARARGLELGIEVLSGVEISVAENEGTVQLHILGLGIDVADPALLATLARIRETRRARAARILERLARIGVPLPSDVDAEGPPRAVGRLHIARALVQGGACDSVDQAFTRYLRRGRPAYESSPGIAAAEAIVRIHEAGGLACLAHPPLSEGARAPGGLGGFVERLARQGLDGIEVWHPGHKPTQTKRLRRIARERGLVETGGSDFHGDAKPGVVPGRGRGGIHVGADVYAAIQARLERRRAAGA